jgi:hypothetical protein
MQVKACAARGGSLSSRHEEDRMAKRRHSRLFPWYVGTGIILAFELYIGLLYFGPACPAPALPQIMVLVVLPVIYLALMFVALRGQP